MNELERLLPGTAGASGDSLPQARTEDAGARAMQRLRATLASRAQQLNLLDVAYRTIDTPVGQLLLAATPAGLVRVAYTRGDYDAVLTALAGQISPRVLFAPGRLDDAARQFDEYFARRRRSFDLAIDLLLSHGFRRTVLEHLPEVGYGARSVTASSPPRWEARARHELSGRHAQPILCPWSSRATGSCSGTARRAATSAGQTSSECSSIWSGPNDLTTRPHASGPSGVSQAAGCVRWKHPCCAPTSTTAF